jgi:signal transduction histidine kinase
MRTAMEPDSGQRPRFWLARRFSPRQADWILFALALISSGIWVAQIAAHHEWLWAALVLLPFLTVPVLFRRRYPGPALALLVCAAALSLAIGRHGLESSPGIASEVGLLCGAYAAAHYGGRRTRLVSGVLVGLAFAAAFVVAFFSHKTTMLLWPIHTSLFAYGVAWVVGDRTRTQRAYVAELEERALSLRRERDEQVRRAGEEERMRIARELHDVVAHNVSVIAVQAGAARVTAGTAPKQALETLGLIERTARSTLAELRTVLGVLRKNQEGGPATRPSRPQPTLRDLDELVAQAREAGLDIETSVEGDPRPLPAVVDLCAYRVIQEAITNVMRHAAGARARVLVRYEATELLVRVTNEGSGPASMGPEGHGLLGMKERVALVNGRLEVGPLPGGGFQVEAHLPAKPEEAGQPAEQAGEQAVERAKNAP